MSSERGAGNGRAQSPEVAAARRIAEEAEALLRQAPSYRQLPPATQAALARDLGTIRRGLESASRAVEEPAREEARADPFAFAIETPFDRVRRGPGPAPAPEPAGSDPAAQP